MLSSLSATRRGLLAALLCGSALLLSACGGTNFGAQTSQIYNAGIGSNHQSGDIEVLNAVFVDNGNGTATLSAGAYAEPPQGDAVSGVDAVNGEGDDVAIQMRSPVDLPVAQLVSVGEQQPTIVISGENFRVGYLIEITLSFESAAPITMRVPVVERTSMYESVAVAQPNQGGQNQGGQNQGGQNQGGQNQGDQDQQ